MNKAFKWIADFTGDYLDHPLDVRGAHDALLTEVARLSIKQAPTGGVLFGAHAFTVARWKRIMGDGGGRRMLDKVVAAGLARWRGGDLVVCLYHQESEDAYMKIAHGKGGPKPKDDGKDAPPAPQPPPTIAPELVPQPIPQPIPRQLPRGEESKAEARKGGKGGGEISAPPAPAHQGTQLIDLIRTFEKGYQARWGIPPGFDKPGELALGTVWDRAGGEGRLRLFELIEEYVAKSLSYGDTTMGDFASRVRQRDAA